MKLLPNDKRARRELLIVMASIVIWNPGLYTLAKLIAHSWYHYDMTLPIDALVPFVPWTVTIYFGCYLFWVVNFYLCANQNSQERDRFFAADALAKIICFLIFLLIPTTNVRPEIPHDQNIWNLLMRFLYWVDTPDNLFPSIHCLASWLCWIGVRKRKDLPVAYRYASLCIALAICLSTLTTRQHVLVDVIAGVFLAELSYFLTGFSKIRGVYSLFLTWLFKLFRTNRL